MNDKSTLRNIFRFRCGDLNWNIFLGQYILIDSIKLLSGCKGTENVWFHYEYFGILINHCTDNLCIAQSKFNQLCGTETPCHNNGPYTGWCISNSYDFHHDSSQNVTWIHPGTDGNVVCVLFKVSGIMMMHRTWNMFALVTPYKHIGTRLNTSHIVEGSFKWIFLKEYVCILIQISLEFAANNPIVHSSTLVQSIAWHRWR